MNRQTNSLYHKILSVACSIFMLSFSVMPAAFSEAQPMIKQLSISEDGSISIQVSEPVEYIYTFIDNPPRLFINFKSSVIADLPASQDVNKGIVSKTRSYYIAENLIDAIVIELSQKTAFTVKSEGGTINVTFTPEKSAKAVDAQTVAAPAAVQAPAAPAKDKAALEAEKKAAEAKEKEEKLKRKAEAEKKAQEEKQKKLLEKQKKAEAERQARIEKEKQKEAARRAKIEKEKAEEAADLQKSGQKAYDKGNYEKAVSLWEKSLQLKSDNKDLPAKITGAKAKIEEKKKADLEQKAQKAAQPQEKKEGGSIWPFSKSKKDDKPAAVKQPAAAPEQKTAVKEEQKAKKLIEDVKKEEARKQEKAEKQRIAQAQEHIDAAEKAYKKEKYESAVSEYEKALQLQPEKKDFITSRIADSKLKLKAQLDQKNAQTAAPAAAKPAEKKSGFSLWPFKKKAVEQKPKQASTIAAATDKKQPAAVVPAPAIQEKTAAQAAAPVQKTAPAVSAPAAAAAKIVEQPLSSFNMSALSLEDCIKIGVKNRLELNIAQEEMVLAKLKLSDAKRQLYPKVGIKEEEMRGKSSGDTASEVTDDIEGRHINVDFEQPLYQGGKLKYSVKQAEVNLAVATRKYNKLLHDYTIQLEEAYYNLANFKHRMEIKKALLERGEEILKNAEQQLKIGNVPELNVLDVKSRFEEIKYDTIAVEKDLLLSRLSLKQLLNTTQEVDIQPTVLDKTLDINIDECLKLAQNHNAQLRVNKLLVEFQQYAIKIAKSQDKFKLDLSGMYGYGDEDFKDNGISLDQEYYAGIKLSKTFGPHVLEDNLVNQDKIPQAGQTTSSNFASNQLRLGLFENNSKTTYKEALIEYYKAVDEFEKTVNSSTFEVTEKFYDYQKSIAQISSSKNKVDYTISELKAVIEQSKLNQASISEVMGKEMTLGQVKVELANAYSAYFIAVARLNKAVGMPGYFNPVTAQIDSDGFFGLPVEENLSNEIAYAEKIIQKAQDEKGISYNSKFMKKNWDKPVFVPKDPKEPESAPAVKTQAAPAQKKRFWQVWK